MALDSTSTIADAWAQYADNLSYDDGAGSLAKARLFRHACRWLLAHLPQQSSAGSTGITMSPALIAAQETRVCGWLDAHDTTVNPNPGATAIGFNEVRR
jgi:hypothetical protein